VSNFLAVPGMATQYGNFQATLFDDESNDLWGMGWSYYKRAPRTRTQHGNSVDGGRWPSRGGFSSDPAGWNPMIGMDASSSAPGDYDNWSAAFGGQQCQKFIMGTTKDASSNIIGGAVVQSFVTSTDTYVSETTSDDNGRYESPTTNVGVAHYLVAYIPGSPDRAGTTVNTLIPTNRDGT
jgi:hypothetical protein